jgi:hypothetical protein
MAKARRGRRPRSPGSGPSGGTGREHWRSDGVPKTRYDSVAEANRSSLQARLERGVELDPYRCSLCSGWHLGTRREP